MIKLKEMRRKRGLTQNELAKMVQWADPTVDQTTISILERGNLYPSEALRDALCKALQCSESDIYDGIEALFVPSVSREYSDTTKMLAEIFAEHGGKILRVSLIHYLCEKTKKRMSDRYVRKCVATARQEGFVIANNQDGDGYYIPQTIKALKDLEKQNNNRAMSILRQQKYIRQKIREKECEALFE